VVLLAAALGDLPVLLALAVQIVVFDASSFGSEAAQALLELSLNV
jgi:hypothetical protein